MDNKQTNELIIGRNACAEALKGGRAIDTLLVVKGIGGSVLKLVAQCKEKGIVVKDVDQKRLDYLCGHSNHQGVAAYISAYEYYTVDNILKNASDKNESPFVIICDEIEDPHNLGAIIRTAEAVGAHGIIIPKRRNAGLSFGTAKSSAGAVEFMPVARVANLAATIDDLKNKGFWVYGLDMDGQDRKKTDFSGAVALVIGSEGNGLGRLVKEKCDVIVSLPMRGHINSLNASVAAGIVMYEILDQRMGKDGKINE